ncbi:hypothetical protein VBX86_000718 [Enterococcus faecalis]|nr:hypothetical protein [Enterococcus faecalis]
MKQLHKNRWLLIGLILITIFSSIGSSLSVIAETLDFSTVETTDTLDEKENSTEIERTKESSIEETAQKTKETENDSDELTSVESSSSDSITEDDGNEITSEESIQENYSLSQRALDFNPPSRGDKGTRAWTPGSTTVEAQRNYLLNTDIPNEYGKEIQINSENKLGGNVGDTIEFSLSRNSIYHRFFDWVNNTGSSESWYGRVNPKNVKATTASPSISAKVIQNSNSEWKIVVTRVKKGYDTDFKVELNYDLQFDYYSSTKFGALPGADWTDWMEQLPVVISNINSSVKIEATPSSPDLGNSIVLGQAESNDNGSVPFAESFIFQLNGNMLNPAVHGIRPDNVIDYKQGSKTVLKAEYGAISNNTESYFQSYLPMIGTGMETQNDLINKWTGMTGTQQMEVSDGSIIYLWSNMSMKDGNTSPRIQRTKDSIYKDDNPEKVSEMYYQIFRGEFHPLSITKLKSPEKVAIKKDISEYELNKMLTSGDSILNFSKYPKVSPIKFKTYPKRELDNQESSAVIQVGERTTQGGILWYDYTVNFKVEDAKLSAEPSNQKINLGEKIIDENLVTDVKLGNQTLTKDDYTVSVQNTVSTDTVGDKTAKVLITYKKDKSKTLSLDVPVNVLWGNSIVLQGTFVENTPPGSFRPISALTLHTNETNKYTITNSIGVDNYTNNNATIGGGGNPTSFKIELYDGNSNGDINLGNHYYQWTADRNNIANQLQKTWAPSMNNALVVNQGDVIKSWAAYKTNGNGEKKIFNGIMKNEELIDVTAKKNEVYYEITKEGYKTLHLNHLDTKNASIPIYSTEEYLDDHISDYIDLKGYPNISVKEFSQYPNTKASGQQKGKIIVEETLTTGKKVQYEYEVTFTIGDGTLTYSVPKTLTFKEFAKSKSEQVIQRTYSGDLGLKISDNRGEGKQGNWRLTAQVSQSEELSPYLIFRDDSLQDKYLNQGATEIYSQAKQSNPTEPLNVEVSGQWTKDTGILLKVPSNNTLSSKQYASTITWNLVEGP